MTYQSRQWSGQFAIAAQPDVFGVCHVVSGDHSEMVCDDNIMMNMIVMHLVVLIIQK